MTRGARSRDRRRAGRASRAQANLPVLAVALVLLTTVTGVCVAFAEGALLSADREPHERRASNVLADRVVAADAPTTDRPNVLNATDVDALSPARVDRLAPVVRDTAFRVRLADETVVERGDPTGGTTVRRAVLVAERSSEERTVDLAASESVTLPRRTSTVALRLRPGSDTTIRTVRANDRVVLHDENGSGLRGNATIRTSRYETTTLSFERDERERTGTNRSETGTVIVTYYPEETTKAVLEVTVDA
ncbi:DUF7263 family protein [Halegenticoccus tardaugens]|uniref:DUF7263 family protein n=1 Tax=Halegenticoccus tardaugens TaxID=2071624 RepID=UPI00100A2CC3|nr:hypothetical protein [Halegenticoccus tardaugens]